MASKKRKISLDEPTNSPAPDRYRLRGRGRRCASDSSDYGDGFVAVVGEERPHD